MGRQKNPNSKHACMPPGPPLLVSLMHAAAASPLRSLSRHEGGGGGCGYNPGRCEDGIMDFDRVGHPCMPPVDNLESRQGTRASLHATCGKQAALPVQRCVPNCTPMHPSARHTHEGPVCIPCTQYLPPQVAASGRAALSVGQPNTGRWPPEREPTACPSFRY